MNKWLIWLAIIVVAAIGLYYLLGPSAAGGQAGAGIFNDFGYNDKAHIFRGPADGVDRNLDGTVWGDPTYANDQLVMKWNAQWDACNAAGNDDAAACAGAWLDNEWNGAAGGSGEVWHYKIVWVGSAGEESEYWQPGGYRVWGNYEVLQDQGVSLNDGPLHTVYANSTPNGYGAAK